MRKKVTYIALVLALLTAGFTVGCRGHRHGSPEQKAEWIAEKISDELDFTENQEAKLDQIKDEVLAKFKEVHTGKKEMHNEVIAKVRNDEITRAYLNSLANKKEALHKKLKPFIIDRVLEVYEMLTPEQRQTLAEKMEDFQERCKY